ncbi:thermonuclease family protein [Devosia sp.]|uniref:thermonuclease family protein n=1 Tax=Devosia sp. TaxID=1871048 RepID=UPI003BAD4616
MRFNDVLRIGALAVLVAMPISARACAGLTDGPRGTVVSVADGDTIVLDTGMVVRLIGTQAPKLPQGSEDFVAWPKAEAARAALETLTLGKQVIIRYGGETMDRHGRTLGQTYVLGSPEIWVQQQMVAAGLARLYTFADNRACSGELMAAEGKARANRLGIWSDPYYAVRRADRPDDLAQRSGHYELVEGRVLQADTVQGRVYLNFGRTWKQDFTAVIDRAALALFSGSGIDPLQLGGALVRVRGWVDVHDGPRIAVTHPEQIEVLAYK